MRVKKAIATILSTAIAVTAIPLTTNEIVSNAAINDVVVHVKSDWKGMNVFYWNKGGGYSTDTSWPGDAMEKEDGWYTYTFDDTSSVDLMFNYGKKQTTHYNKVSGEYWLEDGNWYAKNPEEGDVTPLPTATKAPTPTQKATATPTGKITQKATATPVITRALEATPTQGPEVTLPATTKKITLHYYYEGEDGVNVYYYNVSKGTNTPVAWPGVAMESEGNGWYTYTIEQAKSATVVFLPGKGMTDETVILSGEHWGIGGEILDEKPENYRPGDNTPTPTKKPDVTVLTTSTVVPTREVKPSLQATPTAEATPTLEASRIPEATSTPVPTKPPVKGKMVLHFYNGSNWAKPAVHYWQATGASKTSTEWPGIAMTEEGNNWYTYTIDGATASNLLFVDQANTSAKTDDLKQAEGEWWYKDGKWSDVDLTGPTVTPTTKPTNTPTPTRDPNATNTPTPTPRPTSVPGEGDFRDETIYFLITTRFYDGDSSNNVYTSGDYDAHNDKNNDPSWRGDFKGLIEKLDYIKALGFTAVWITPVVQNNSNYDYHGYHAYNFSKIDSRYESQGVKYQDLVDAVHGKGMKIIQDIVLNHTCSHGEENLKVLTGETAAERQKIIMDGTGDDPNNPIFHHEGWTGSGGYDEYKRQNSTMDGECFDLETENPTVYNYLIDCYKKIMDTGVDGFRIDTVAHISRLTFNQTFLPAFKEHAKELGNDDFFMYGEVCTKGHDVWYRTHPGISTCFYTWAETDKWASKWTNSTSENEALVEQHFLAADSDLNEGRTSQNAFLSGNEYHTPDYSESSGMAQIDFQVHYSFDTAENAFNMAKKQDAYFNDATWNVVYVDSHDYGPDAAGYDKRYPKGTDAWAENLSFMFTFRGIPCIYYGSEIEFQAGQPIDKGTCAPLAETGRAYYGDHLEGTVTASDFGDYTASGEVATTLKQPLCTHLRKLNKIRAAVPALRKGQYSTEGVSGQLAYKRRYTDADTDSFACISVSGGATFSGIPNGTYVDACTGDTKEVTNGTLSVSCSGQGNLRVYVLSTDKTPAPGQVAADIEDSYIK